MPNCDDLIQTSDDRRGQDGDAGSRYSHQTGKKPYGSGAKARLQSWTEPERRLYNLATGKGKAGLSEPKRPAFGRGDAEVSPGGHPGNRPVGQWTREQHLNHAWRGHTQAEFSRADSSRTIACGTTEWSELGFYQPFALASAGERLSDAAKTHRLFVIPHAAKRSFFCGAMASPRGSDGLCSIIMLFPVCKQ